MAARIAPAPAYSLVGENLAWYKWVSVEVGVCRAAGLGTLDDAGIDGNSVCKRNK